MENVDPRGKNGQKNLKNTHSVILSNSDRLNRTISESNRESHQSAPESLRRERLEVKGKHIEILKQEEILVYKETFRQARHANVELLFCDQDSLDTELFGYMFILQNLLNMENFNRFVEVARMLSFENDEILRDVQDFLIVQSLRSVGKEYFINKDKASSKMKFFMDQNNKENREALGILKPPFVWNFYRAQVEQKKRFFSANPFKEFKHLEFLEKELGIMGEDLKNHNKEDWGNFQLQIIKFFNNQQIKELV